MIHIGKFIAAALVAAFSCPAFAQQQQSCAKRVDIIDHLAKKYHEAQVSIGLSTKGTVVEVLSTASGSTWTIIATTPHGMSCLIANGENWERIPAALKGQGL